MDRLFSLAYLASVLFFSVGLHALPEGGAIAQGDAKLECAEKTLQILQGSDRLILNWDQFSIGKEESVSFVQPSSMSAVLNRVISETPSELLGTLQSNGQVYLINPWGIIVGPEGVIDTAGFLASTLHLSDDDFLMGGDLQFFGDSTGSILQMGKIGASNGDVFLLGSWVRNTGEIVALQGKVGIAAGREILLKAEGEERIYISGTISSSRVDNEGMIAATAVEIQSCAGNPYALAICHSGTISANGFEREGGKVFLKAVPGEVTIDGTIFSQKGPDGGSIDVRGSVISATEASIFSADAQSEGNGGSIALIADERVEISGACYARGGTVQGDGGFIEYSAGHVRFDGPIDATAQGKGAHGTFLLDPYDVYLSFTDPGGMISWVDTNPGMPFITALDGGMNLTIDTLACTNCTTPRSMALLGDITVVDSFTVVGTGTLTLTADQDVFVNAGIVNSSTGGFDLNATRDVTVNVAGNILAENQDINITAGRNVQIDGSLQTNQGGDITINSTVGAITMSTSVISTALNVAGTGGIALNSPGGTIDFGTTGICDVRNPNSLLSIIALNQISANTGALNSASWQVRTSGSPITITSTNGPILMLGGFGFVADCVTAPFTAETTMSGDITWVGSIYSGTLTLDAADDLWIGNDSTGTLAMDSVTTGLFDVNQTSALICRGNNVTIRAGEGMNQNINAAGHGDLEVTARTGDFRMIGGSNINGGVDIRSASPLAVTQVFSAVNGAGLFLAGTGDTNNTQAGNSGLGGSPPGILNITTLGDCTLQANTGMYSGIDVRTGTGTWTIGGNLRCLASSNTNSQIICYQSGTNGQATLDVGLAFDATGGSGDNAFVQFGWSDVDFRTGTAAGMNDGTITVQGGLGLTAFSEVSVGCSTAAARIVDGDVLILGGLGDDAVARFSVDSGGGTLTINRNLTIEGGLGERASALMSSGAQTIDVGNNLLIQGQTASSSLDFSSDPGNILLVRNQADILGGMGGLDSNSTGNAMISGQNDLQMEVINNLTITGGTGTDAGASIQMIGLGVPAPELIYVGGDIRITTNTTSNGFAGISLLQVMSSGVQRIEAGGDIVILGGIGTSTSVILGSALIDPMGVFFMFPIDQPGPDSFIRALGSITCMNGTSTNAAGLQNINNIVLPIPIPPGVGFSTGNVTIQAARDISLSSLISAGTTLGTTNLNQSIYIEANTQFAAGALWPGSIIMPVSSAAMFPNGALIGDSAPLMTTIDLSTIQNNISLLSAQNNAAAAATDFTTGAVANDFRLFMTNGNILIEGFNDIVIGQALTTTGNGTLVAPATDQIFIRTFQNITVDNSIDLTGGMFSLRMVADKNTVGSFNILLNDDVDVDTVTGVAQFFASTGFIHQTTGTITGYNLIFNADLGVISTLFADAAVRTSSTFIVGANTTSGELNIFNTLAGPNTFFTSINLINGTGAMNTGRNVYYEQHGGTSSIISSAVADGNVSTLIYDGLANITFKGAAIAGANMIGMAFQNMTINATGSISALENVTLICDEYAGSGFGGSTFTNLSAMGGITSSLIPPNIAIYSSSGPQPPPGLATANLTILGNLIAIETWDIALPAGLASKYDTSWQSGGAYHGAGFGTNYAPGTGVFGSPVVWYKALDFLPPTPGTNAAAAALVLSLEAELFQALSLINDIFQWGEEMEFQISSGSPDAVYLPEQNYYYAQDPRHPLRVSDIYQRCVRRKFLNVP